MIGFSGACIGGDRNDGSPAAASNNTFRIQRPTIRQAHYARSPSPSALMLSTICSNQLCLLKIDASDVLPSSRRGHVGSKSVEAETVTRWRDILDDTMHLPRSANGRVASQQPIFPGQYAEVVGLAESPAGCDRTVWHCRGVSHGVAYCAARRVDVDLLAAWDDRAHAKSALSTGKL